MPVDPDAPLPELLVGVARALSPLVRRIVAPNPGIMTGPGTNTYLVGVDEIAVIDPGPADPDHLDTIAGCGGDRIRWILCTHAHSDHAPGAAGLRERTGAEVLAFGSRAELTVDRRLADGEVVEGTEFRLVVLHTPGHASDHLCFELPQERMLFSGDHIMEGSTVVIAPPDGDMGAYVAQLERLGTMRFKAIAPGHGQLITDPAAKIAEYLAHRRLREEAVASALRAAGSASIPELVRAVYTDVPEHLHAMATYSLWAHLRHLADLGRAEGDGLEDRWHAT